VIIPFLDLGAQHRPIQNQIDQAIARVFELTNFVLGDEVTYFEQEYADYCGVKYAVGLDSGLSALHLALEAYGVGPGDEVIVPANTFIATAAAATFCGARVVLVDIDPATYQIDPSAIEEAVTERTKAIIPVHLYGAPADMESVMQVAERHNLLVLEDACQAHGALYNGHRVGSIGHAAAFSFYPGKNLGAAGDAGILVTNDEGVATKVRAMRNCGQREKYHHVTTPYNHRLDTIQAAVLRIKLRYIDEWNAQRRANADLYGEFLSGLPGIVVPRPYENSVPVWHLYVIRHDRRDELQAHLTKCGIATGMHYPIPIHLQPYYASLGYQHGDFSITEQYAQQILSLPMYPELTAKQIRYVCDAIIEFLMLEPASQAHGSFGD